MEDFILRIVSTGGSLGAVGLLVYYMIKKDHLQQEKDKMFNITLNNHFDHVTKAMEKDADAHLQLAEAFKEVKTVMIGCPHNKLNYIDERIPKKSNI